MPTPGVLLVKVAVSGLGAPALTFSTAMRKLLLPSGIPILAYIASSTDSVVVLADTPWRSTAGCTTV